MHVYDMVYWPGITDNGIVSMGDKGDKWQKASEGICEEDVCHGEDATEARAGCCSGFHNRFLLIQFVYFSLTYCSNFI